jgi:hypothetical protein
LRPSGGHRKEMEGGGMGGGGIADRNFQLAEEEVCTGVNRE